MTTCVNWGNKQ